MVAAIAALERTKKFSTVALRGIGVSLQVVSASTSTLDPSHNHHVLILQLPSEFVKRCKGRTCVVVGHTHSGV
jgi:hypothetical protein